MVTEVWGSMVKIRAGSQSPSVGSIVHVHTYLRAYTHVHKGQLQGSLQSILHKPLSPEIFPCVEVLGPCQGWQP